MFTPSVNSEYFTGMLRCLPSAIVVDRSCLGQFSFRRSSLLANIVNTCGGFVIIKPELGLDLAKDAIKTTVYLG